MAKLSTPGFNQKCKALCFSIWTAHLKRMRDLKTLEAQATVETIDSAL